MGARTTRRLARRARITFTMPKTLWPVFCENPHLTKALAELAATVIMAWAKAKHGLRVGVISILQTFNGRLEFNSHVHTLVTSGGLQGSGQWLSSVFYCNDSLMKAWRNGIRKLIRTALSAGQLRTKMTNDQVMRPGGTLVECQDPVLPIYAAFSKICWPLSSKTTNRTTPYHQRYARRCHVLD